MLLFTADVSECDGGFCPCNGNYSVVVNDTTQLPIRKIELGSSSGTRAVILESVKCFGKFDKPFRAILV